MAVSVDFESVEQIPHLLYDATIHCIRWSESLRQMEMDFSVLRCDEAGNNIDRPITLQLQHVAGIASYRSVPRYIDGERPDPRPMELIAAYQLEEWKESSGCYLKINSDQGRVEFETALQAEWIFGSDEDDSNITIHFGANMGSLQILCDQIEILDDHQVIPVEQWVAEYSNWWEVWHEHCDSCDDSDEHGSSGFDAAAQLDLDKRPAAIPQPSDREVFPDYLEAPGRILQPIRDYLEGLHQRDWLRAARAFPWLDNSEKINADHLADQHIAGPWFYAREIDQHWTEDNFACVTVRGVEYIPNMGEQPASTREAS